MEGETPSDELIPLRKINAEELGAFHLAKNVTNSNCLRCGQDVWKVMSDDEVPSLTLPAAKRADHIETDLFLPVLTLVCSNCSTLWQIAMGPLLSWLDENRKDASH